MARTIHVTLSPYEGDSFPDADSLFEDYVLAELARQHPSTKIEVSTALGKTRVFIDGEPDDDMAAEIGCEWWDRFVGGL